VCKREISKSATLYHGDCKDVLLTLDAESVSAIVTDPPYECSQSLITRPNQKDLNSNFGEWDKFFTGWLTQAYRVLKPDSCAVIFVPATRFETLMHHCEIVGLKYVQPWFYYKHNPPPAIRTGLQWAIEHMIYVTKGKHALRIANRGKCHNIFHYPIPSSNRFHPTQKPIGMMKEIIEYVSDKGDMILDPFSGSGATISAAMACGRRVVGIEKDESFFNKSASLLKRDRSVY